MRGPATLLVPFLVVAAACSTSGGSTPASSSAATAGPAATGTGMPMTGASASSPGQSSGLPSPDAPLPVGAVALAEDLASTTTALRSAVERWLGDGSTDAWPPPENVQLLGLHQQRLYRTLAAAPALARNVLGRLPGNVRGEARDDVAAGAALLSLARPVSDPGALRTRPPEPAAVLLGYYREAQRRFGVDWQLLAAVNFIESKFGRVVSPSWAGAQGPMQFIPSTWATYGMGGDVRDPRDAIMGAANYLRASGALQDEWRAVYAYNPVPSYVSAVLHYAKRMRQDPRAYYAYYTWQVYVLTKHGAVRLTGPGVKAPGSG
ncbi:MAG TPA: lytic transglycosylase domain-containing protein [Actinomycetota bacterium]